MPGTVLPVPGYDFRLFLCRGVAVAFDFDRDRAGLRRSAEDQLFFAFVIDKRMRERVFRNGLKEIERDRDVPAVFLDLHTDGKVVFIPQFLQIEIGGQIFQFLRQRRHAVSLRQGIAEKFRQVDDAVVQIHAVACEGHGGQAVERVEQEMVVNLQIRHLFLGVGQRLLGIQHLAETRQPAGDPSQRLPYADARAIRRVVKAFGIYGFSGCTFRIEMLASPQDPRDAVVQDDRDEIHRHMMRAGIAIDAVHLRCPRICDGAAMAGTTRGIGPRPAVLLTDSGITVVLQDHVAGPVEQAIRDADPVQDLAPQGCSRSAQLFAVFHVQFRVDIIAADGAGQALITSFRQRHGIRDHEFHVRNRAGIHRFVRRVGFQAEMVACPDLVVFSVEFHIRFALQDVQKLLVRVVHVRFHAFSAQDAGRSHGKPAFRIGRVGQVFPIDISPFGLLSHDRPSLLPFYCSRNAAVMLKWMW